MSRSNSSPAGKSYATPTEDLLPGIDHPWMISAEAVPATARSQMRTVDPLHRVGAPRQEETDPCFLVASADFVLRELEIAAREMAGGEATHTRFGFFETRNDATGEGGIIVRKLLSPGRYSRPLAELLGPSGRFTEETRNLANWLARNAEEGRLEIIVYEEREQKRPRPAVFAAVGNAEVPDRVQLLARLLVTPFEISQWTVPAIENPDSVKGA